MQIANWTRSQGALFPIEEGRYPHETGIYLYISIILLVHVFVEIQRAVALKGGRIEIRFDTDRKPYS